MTFLSKHLGLMYGDVFWKQAKASNDVQFNMTKKKMQDLHSTREFLENNIYNTATDCSPKLIINMTL